MVSIASLPACGQPATTRFEVWTPLNGHPHGSLDGVVYTCQQHAPEVVQSVHAAGLTPLRVADPRHVARPCGHLVDFGAPLPELTHQTLPTIPPTTAPLELHEPPAEPKHPRWCVRGELCRAERRHVSDPHHANPSGSYLEIWAWLEQSWAPAGAPVQMVLETGDGGKPAEYRMELRQPRALLHVLRTLLRGAGQL